MSVCPYSSLGGGLQGWGFPPAGPSAVVQHEQTCRGTSGEDDPRCQELDEILREAIQSP